MVTTGTFITLYTTHWQEHKDKEMYHEEVCNYKMKAKSSPLVEDLREKKQKENMLNYAVK